MSLRFTDDTVLTGALGAGFLEPSDDDRLTLQVPSDAATPGFGSGAPRASRGTP